MAATTVTCCIAGCGPAGAMAGYLLARAGVDVLVLEKHADFLRDFRGDTIHPSTSLLMDELGLGERFARLPLRHSDTLSVVTDDGQYTVADFRRIPGGHTLAFLPQWDFLNFITDEADRYPGFELRTEAEVTRVLEHGDRVAGVQVRDSHGVVSEVHADLVIAADGRGSVVRSSAGLRVINLGAPIDVLWFRVPRAGDDPDTAFGRLAADALLVMIDRGDYWQVGSVIAKDGFAALRARGLPAFRDRITSLAPFLGDRMEQITGWDEIRLLRVQLNRLRRWWRPGLLCIGDAAHAMSPVGGVGINLAVQDAVAAARILARPLRDGQVSERHLRRIQIRRAMPTIITQAGQQLAHRRILAPRVAGRAQGRTPAALRVLDRYPVVQAVPAYVIGRGVLPEHAPPASHG